MVGRGADGIEYASGLKVQASLTLSGEARPPIILAQPQSQAATAGSNVTFKVTASGTAPLSYQWLLDGVNLAGATDPMLVLINVQPGQAGGYSVVVANAVDSVTSDVATLTVNSPPPGQIGRAHV